ncbi:hypothetical protein Tco_1531479 [Tanacetum coccineum]
MVETFDAKKKDDEGVNKKSGINDQERPENSTQDVNTTGPSINTASTNVNTRSLNINTVSPTVTTAPLEATHADFFHDETEIDMSNITTTYLVPSTPKIRIHKEHSLDHVIGDVQSGVLTRRMTKTTNEQGFISAVYEGKTHKDLHTCLFACFLSQKEPKKTASTPMETSKPLIKDENAEDVNVHYKIKIGVIDGIVVQGEGLTHLESVVPQPRSPTQSPVADEAASTDNLEDPSKQGRKIAEIDQDPTISLVQHDAKIQGRHEHDMEFNFDLDVAKDVSTAKIVSTAGAVVTKPVSTGCTAGPTVSTADDITMAKTLVYIRKSATKDKGKGKMDESKPVQTKTKMQQEKERLGYEEVVRLQAKLEEKESQRIARVHEAASSFNVEEWEDIQARVEVDEELAQRFLAEEREMYIEAEQVRMLVELINQRKESEVDRAVPKLAAGSLKRDAEEELGQESSKRQNVTPLPKG